MQTNQQTQSIFRSIWFWWFVTTTTYTVLYICNGLLNIPEKALLTLGLFVPYGPLSLLLFVEGTILSGISVFFFVIAMIYINKLLKNKEIGTGQMIVIIFFTLLLLTTVVDIIRGTPFFSWKFLFVGTSKTLGI